VWLRAIETDCECDTVMNQHDTRVRPLFKPFTEMTAMRGFSLGAMRCSIRTSCLSSTTSVFGRISIAYPATRCGFAKTAVRRHSSPNTPSNIQFPPYKGHCVDLSVISGGTTQMLSKMLVQPALDEQKYMRLANYSFLISSSHRRRKALFDLAFMKDVLDRMPPALKAMFAMSEEEVMKLEEVIDIPDALQAHDVELGAVNDIILSHSHIDHFGDPAVFPASTNLVVGPGFKQSNMPGYPENSNAMTLESAYAGRQVNEIAFSNHSPTIGGFRALDFFDDSSFWLLECPGHTGHHIGALCRTTEDSWVFLGADCAHSVAQLRPNRFRQLPSHLSDAVLDESTSPSPCICTLLRQRLREGHDGPAQELAPMLQEDVESARETLEKVKAFDGRDDVMVILAHDPSLLDKVDFFPAHINGWRAKGLAEQLRWSFLKDT